VRSLAVVGLSTRVVVDGSRGVRRDPLLELADWYENESATSHHSELMLDVFVEEISRYAERVCGFRRRKR
jgi:hypothetical protein